MVLVNLQNGHSIFDYIESSAFSSVPSPVIDYQQRNVQQYCSTGNVACGVDTFGHLGSDTVGFRQLGSAPVDNRSIVLQGGSNVRSYVKVASFVAVCR